MSISNTPAPEVELPETLEQIVHQLHQVDADLAVAGKAAMDYLNAHPDVMTAVVGGQIIGPRNAMARSAELAQMRKEYATLESARNRLVEKRNLILARYAQLKMEAQKNG